MKYGKLLLMSLLLFVGFFASYAFADDALAPADFFSQVLQTVQSFGGLSTLLKISAIVLLVVSSMKVTYLNKLIWSKLGSAQIYVAPVLSIIAGILGLGTVTLPAIFAYLSAGAGAVFMHEILDSLKAVPGLGTLYVTIINMIESALGGPAAQGSPSTTVAQQPTVAVVATPVAAVEQK